MKKQPDGYCQECGQYDPATEAICDTCLPKVLEQERTATDTKNLRSMLHSANGFAQWDNHCAQVKHITITQAYDRGLIKSLHERKTKIFAGYFGNPFGIIVCTMPGCSWRSK